MCVFRLDFVAFIVYCFFLFQAKYEALVLNDIPLPSRVKVKNCIKFKQKILEQCLFPVPGEQQHHQPSRGVHQQGVGGRDQCVQVPGDWTQTGNNLPESEPRSQI